ncbi:hypothetical protein [Methanimicrococcus blatticola]|uniref:Uncharacterized protein n=1 Tax=Methanimicrococcus blatticola TaxID=91560 RepID=A0A484F780_9EURY|nr:hypothetical protein [Methanimicrococcus blatticola]MBZ3935577.1 hypothetical protein [Methanimicrococcus blatticola]MCC2509219.1 hypothetical protein [Methanimicrococcus blatticola]TDQ69414.1 hypothetical protein C7391_0740 [Methanimicrococcus blatticola]
MSIYNQLQVLQYEFEKYRDADTDKPSFFYFVEHCGKVKGVTDTFFEDVSEMTPIETPVAGNNLQTVQIIRTVARKTMAEQKLVAKASELPISKAWTANGISETMVRIKKLEQNAAVKTENLTKIETMIATTMTVGNYKSIKKVVVESLREKIKNPKASVESHIPVKYRVFIGKEDIQTANMILNFIVPEMEEANVDEIENMNYVSFKYSILMLITALRLTYEFPPNYEIYRFCATLPKNPNENSELIQKLENMIVFTDSKMSNVMKLAKIYEKYEQYESKVLGEKD